MTFDNPQQINLDYLQPLIKSKLIDEIWFYADQWQLPDLHFGTWDNEVDHTWHEFESIEYTNEPANTALDLVGFIIDIGKTNKRPHYASTFFFSPFLIKTILA